MSSDVEYYTRLARGKLHSRNDEDAVDNFREALRCARESADTEAIWKCIFNLGAALVALGRTSEGLKELESVTPREHDHLLTGDLWYNLCLAHDDLGNGAEAIKCIQQATECYSECSDATVMKASSACRLASLYAQSREFEKAAGAYADAASLYGIATNVLQQAVCLFEQARLLETCEKHDDAIAVADTCAKVCTERPNAGVGKCRS